MHKPISPTSIYPPFSNYSHGMEVAPGSRFVFCAGQLGITAEGTVPSDIAAQTRLCFANIEAVLAEAGMDLGHIVRVNAFVSAREHLQPYMQVRNEILAGIHPASTLVIVSGFTRPELLVEVEVIAAGPA